MQYRSLKVATPPAVEPVTLAEAKHHCRIDTSNDDAYVSALITAAREWCESYCDESFVHREYVMKLDSFPVEIELPKPPMASAGTCTAVSVTYTLESSATVTLSETRYRVDRDALPGVIRNNYSGSWPAHRLDQNAITVRWWGGYGPDGSSVSQKIKSAILWLVGLWYERRMAADAASLSEIPFGVKALLDSSRWGSYR